MFMWSLGPKARGRPAGAQPPSGAEQAPGGPGAFWVCRGMYRTVSHQSWGVAGWRCRVIILHDLL